MLPVAALSKMRRLVEFKLQIKGCGDFSRLTESGVLGAMPQLTCLDLSGNDLTSVPSCTALTNLEELDVSDNMSLQLTPDYLGELRPLSHLRCLNLTKGDNCDKAEWSINSFKTMAAIAKELPDLIVKIE